MRRLLPTVLAVLVLVAGVGAAVAAIGGAGQSTVTRARLEASLPVVFEHSYVRMAHLLGRDDVTPASLEARAMCDKHGPDVADVGPGGDWICLMSWTDPELPMPPEGYGKFELNVHSNDCYTAVGPTKLTGFLTLTDTRGHDVTNPVFEFDGCFDPGAADPPSGVQFPSLLSVTSTTATPSQGGRLPLQVTCGTGSAGCSGTVTATAGDVTLGELRYWMKEESTDTLIFTTPPTTAPATATDSVTFTFTTIDGFGPPKPVTLPIA